MIRGAPGIVEDMHTTQLYGTWELLSYYDIDDANGTSTGPLGEAPRGVLIYASHGDMSVSMMRTDGAPGAVFMGYAGTWRREDDRLVHTIAVCSNPALAGTDQVRSAEYGGDTLTLVGSAVVEGRVQRRILTWRRTRPSD
ncbi:lipocalin-like domain-containing protein [Nocardia asteroides]|uniref:lipocalin-like domain-containing protein n=1 Tax=Nocardia asteroides TaxID=1824 RepID=UPI001E4AC370|nr:lipocalin-like domain-containing protein [Nocardia asteroides]UGT63379.1 lipocalin-like domain-containing protein [Nocardia asteroides]